MGNSKQQKKKKWSDTGMVLTRAYLARVAALPVSSPGAISGRSQPPSRTARLHRGRAAFARRHTATDLDTRSIREGLTRTGACNPSDRRWTGGLQS